MKKSNLFLRFSWLFMFAVLVHGFAFAQTKKVTGVVKDATGETLIGVSVQAKGTTAGTLTDLNGRYSLDVPEEATTLVFSYLGMLDQEVQISGPVADITMSDDTKTLEDVVVVGYGVMKKRDLTGAVSSLGKSELQKIAGSNAMQAMQGKIAGLDIQQESGAGGSLKINLRGNRSINAGNDPLIIVDGVEYGSTIDINSSDIASMEILKDAASTAIYGTRGANGVIIITTKRGGETKCGQKTKVSYSGYMSVNSPTLVPSTMTAEEDVNFLINKQRYADYLSGDATLVEKSNSLANYQASDVISGNALELLKAGKSVDWFDELLSNSITQNHEISVSGGGDKTAVNFSLGYLDENGLMENDNLKRYNTKLSIDQIISPSVKTGISILFSRRDWDKPYSGSFSQAVKLHALSDIENYDSHGMSSLADSHTNPLLNQMDGNYQNTTSQNRLFGNTYVSWEITKGLTAKTSFASDIKNTFQGIYEDYKTSGRYQAGSPSYVSQENTQSTNLTLDNTINYKTEIAKRHDIEALLGQSVNSYESLYSIISGTAGQTHLDNGYYDLASLTTINKPEDQYIKSTMESYFGRVNYKYDERYLFQATLRADGSSVLADGHKWGYFPSASLGWRITEEDFLKNKTSYINNLKLRYSWGVAGNAAIDPYQTLSMLAGFDNKYSFNGVSYSGFTPGQLGNSNLTWETTATHDIGFDFSFLRDRISGSIDLYYSTTNDLLLYKTLPPTSGYPATWDNVGSTENKGIEIVLTTRNIENKNFKWSTDFSYSLNRDKVTGLASGAEQDYSNPDRALKVGESVFSFLDYELDGTWGTDEADEAALWNRKPGDLKIKDQNGDGIIDENDRILYNQSPDFIFGLNNHFTYKMFTLDILTYARVGQWIDYDLYNFFNSTVQDGTPAGLDYWTLDNQDTRFPSPGTSTSVEGFSALGKVKASYWKIKDITLSYNVPTKLLKHVGVENARVYGSMKNWFTFSNIDNYDPEQAGSINNALMKQVVFGLNLDF